MTDFSTTATIKAQLDTRSAKNIRDELEETLSPDPLTVEADVSRRPGSAMSGLRSDGGSGGLGSVRDAINDTLEAQSSLLEDIRAHLETAVEQRALQLEAFDTLSEDLEDVGYEVAQNGGGGSGLLQGFALSSIFRGGLASAGAAGAASVALPILGGLIGSGAKDFFQENLPDNWTTSSDKVVSGTSVTQSDIAAWQNFSSAVSEFATRNTGDGGMVSGTSVSRSDFGKLFKLDASGFKEAVSEFDSIISGLYQITKQSSTASEFRNERQNMKGVRGNRTLSDVSDQSSVASEFRNTRNNARGARGTVGSAEDTSSKSSVFRDYRNQTEGARGPVAPGSEFRKSRTNSKGARGNRAESRRTTVNVTAEANVDGASRREVEQIAEQKADEMKRELQKKLGGPSTSYGF